MERGFSPSVPVCQSLQAVFGAAPQSTAWRAGFQLAAEELFRALADGAHGLGLTPMRAAISTTRRSCQ